MERVLRGTNGSKVDPMTRRASPETATAAIKVASPRLVGAACADAAVVKSADIRASVLLHSRAMYAHFEMDDDNSSR